MKTSRNMTLSIWLFIFSLASFSLRADILDNWHWRNPTPFANSLRSICFGAGKFVAVGDGGVIHTSTDGATWDDGRRPVTSTLRKVIFANGQFVAVGDNGAIVMSSDGSSWTNQASGTTNALYSVTYGNGKYVACGQGGILTSSANGSAWVPGSLGTADLNWITFGNGVFVVPTSNQQMAVQVSADLQTWTTETFPNAASVEWPHYLFQTEFGNGVFIAAVQDESLFTEHIYQPDTHFYRSTDGTNWTQGAAGGALSNQFRFLTFANGSFNDFAANNGGSSEILYRTIDGTAGTFSLPPTDMLYATGIAYGNGKYVVPDLYGEIWTSTDTTNWTARYGGFRTSVHQIIQGANSYVALADSQPVLVSPDGMNFTAVTNSPTGLIAIAFDGTNYVAVGGIQVYTSSNSIDWVQRTSNTSKALAAICHGATRWIAVGRSGTIITSPNTLAWTLRTSGTANNLTGVTFGNNLYVAVGDGGTIITSSDGTAWDVQFSGTIADLHRVQFLNGQFFAIGANGTILTSPDGSTWSVQNLGTPQTLADITYGDGHYVLCSFGNAMLFWSTNGTNWTDITTKIPVSVALNSIAFLNGSFWLCGENGALLQSDSLDGIPRLNAILPPGNAGPQLRIPINVPQTYRIQTSTNPAIANSWQDTAWITNSPIWNDTNTTGIPMRFYRIAAP